MSIYDKDYRGYRYAIFEKQRKPFNGHYPSKDEAKVLRRIMSQTGLTEEQVRSKEKYRKLLASTQTHNVQRDLDNYAKSVVEKNKVS